MPDGQTLIYLKNITKITKTDTDQITQNVYSTM
jgi:hypothetical protein